MAQPGGTEGRRFGEGAQLAGRLAAFGVASALLAWFGDVLTLHQSGFATFWPAAGLLVAGLLLAPPRLRPLYALVAAVAGVVESVLLGRSLPVMLAMAGVDVAEAVLAAAVARTLARGRPLDGSVRGIAALLWGAAIGSAAGGALGAAITVLRHPGRFGFAEVAWQWWAGDALGVLAMAPFVLAWSRYRPRRPALARAVEAAALLAAVAGSAWAVYGDGVRLDRSYLLLPPLVWAAVRFGLRGAAGAAAVISAASGLATAGAPLPALSAWDRFASFEIQLLLAITLGTALLLGAALEERERAHQRADAAQRLASVGTLAAGMAHEINNPLTYVTANLAYAAEALARLPGDGPAGDALRALEDAQEGARRVSRIVRDLRAVSRVDANGTRPVDLRAEVAAALKMAGNEIRHRARLVSELGAVPVVNAPEFQLGQVAVNLLVNAAHAIPEGAAERNAIRVTTRAGARGEVILEVADTGGGIPPAIRARIFEPFFTTKPVGEGTGLGLSVCHGIVTALGGRIEVESAEGRGSLFRVVLPAAGGAPRASPAPVPVPVAAPAPAPARPPPRIPTPAPGRARILVVDDEPLIGASVARMLREHEVVVLSDPRVALARLEAGEAFDVVLCDLVMPELTGMELHDALARTRPEVARRMVFVTGGAFTDGARAFLARTGVRPLAKPFTPDGLREAIRRGLDAAG